MQKHKLGVGFGASTYGKIQSDKEGDGVSKEELLERYTPAQRYKIHEFLNELACRTRKSKRISESRQTKIIEGWIHYDADVVINALEIYMKMTPSGGITENYVVGIMRNKQREKAARFSAKNSGRDCGKLQEKISATEARLGELAAGGKIDTDCDF